MGDLKSLTRMQRIAYTPLRTCRDLNVALVNQVHHDLDFVELVHVDFVFLLLARQNESDFHSALASCVGSA